MFKNQYSLFIYNFCGKDLQLFYSRPNILTFMKGFSIGELLIYDPTRVSPKRKPIEIDIQQAKIVAYIPKDVALQQKCNTVGMAEGVYNFCHTLLTGQQRKDEYQKKAGWQTVFMDCCTLILSEVQQNIWMFVKLQHDQEASYSRPSELEQNTYLDNGFNQNFCRIFMDNLYQNFRLFYGNIRGWVFRQRFQELGQILQSFVFEYQDLYKIEKENRLDYLSFCMKDLRLIPLDVNSTLKFSHFKNVLQSYNPNILHMLVFAYGALAYTSLGKNTTQLFAKYLFSFGEPYTFYDQHKTRMKMHAQIPKSQMSQKFRTIYNTKVIGFQQSKQPVGPGRTSVSVSKSKETDLLGLQSDNRFELFEVYIEQEQLPVKISFYSENNMFFISFFKQSPTLNEMVFQNRFFHDNSDRFIQKINESLPSLIKPNDPYKFLFHNCATYTGKSTIKEWKTIGLQLIKDFNILQSNTEGIVATTTPMGWICGMHKYSRILILIVPLDIQLNRLDEYVAKMTKQYFARAYV